MKNLKTLLEMFTGTMMVAPVAAGAMHAENFGCMRKNTESVMYEDCVYNCDDDGNPIVYCAVEY